MINIELLDKIDSFLSTTTRKDFNASHDYIGALKYSRDIENASVELWLTIQGHIYTFMIVSSDQYTYLSQLTSEIIVCNYNKAISFNMDNIESDDDIFNMSLLEDVQGITVEVLNKIKQLQDKTIKIIEDYT
ncbi:hypothetical protein XaC1_468 [Xanthomonas phage XaC1]|nr:hypothetical protein XaC1_468 [Xanthomonas phage XaC1]